METLRTLAVGLALVAACAAQPRPIDQAKSEVVVRVFKSGVLSFAGHEHSIVAKEFSGTVDEQAGSVQLSVDARKLRVADEGISEADRQKIQETMESEVLQAAQFPEIRFRSTSSKRSGEHVWSVAGTLLLHGAEKPVKLQVTEASGAYSGEVKVKQTDFRITPVKAAGGAVKVKDELLISFRIVLE